MAGMYLASPMLLLLLASFSTICWGLAEQDFAPTVTATCKAGYMTIKVHTNASFVGAVHAKDHRRSECLANGDGSKEVTLTVNLLAPTTSPEYCGVIMSNRTEDRSLPIAVRIHRTLELADDKFYVITCGKAGFRNAKNETSTVSLKVLDKVKMKRAQEVVYSHPYILRAELSRPDGTYGIRVKSCFAFNKRENNVQLIDDKGCPVGGQVMTQFVYDAEAGHADSTLHSMFQFPDSNQLHFQCDVALCKGGCPQLDCDDLVTGGSGSSGGSSGGGSPSEDGVLLASTSVFVLQPGDTPALEEVVEVVPRWGPSWLVYLCIALGLLFLLMLIVNVFLCSAMTCSCARTEIVEKEPSIVEEYDPYRSWHGTQYGSRYSLNGKPGGGYISGGSTLNSARSVSTNSDHYAIVESTRHHHNNQHHMNTGHRLSPAPTPSHLYHKH